jgi:signal transduction histidine kinase
MDAQETRIYTAAIIIIIVFAAIVIYFVTSILRQQQKNLDLQKENFFAEITAIERDRSRIAHDLHNELGPILSFIKLKINIFELTDPDDKVQLEKVNDSIDNVVTRVRGISYDLMPAGLLSDGLATALSEYINAIDREILQIDFTFPDTIKLSEEASLNIYRIVQEVILNTIKHANASHLDIFFKEEINKVIITLKDNGIGFDLKKIINKRGLGLKGLYSRAKFMDGKIFLKSTKGSGTEIIFEIPN